MSEVKTLIKEETAMEVKYINLAQRLDHIEQTILDLCFEFKKAFLIPTRN